MLRHADIWAAIDRLAKERGLTASGLARRAGLDPTTFNKSKRVTREGKPRWPSTESIAKVLGATGTSVTEFSSLLGDDRRAARPSTLPLLRSVDVTADQARGGAVYDKLRAAGTLHFPEPGDDTFAIEMSDDRLAPVYRRGDVVIVSMRASIRRGHRVMVRTPSGEFAAGQVLRHNARGVVLKRLGSAGTSDDTLSFKPDETAWLMRVLWVSQ